MNLKLRELKRKTPKELLEYAEELGVENASSMRTQDMLFSILKNLASDKKEIDGEGVCLLYTSPSPRDGLLSRMPSSA